MANLVRDSIYSVRGLIKRTNDDSCYTNREIYRLLKNFRKILINQETNKSRVLDTNIVQHINCLSFELKDLSDCCGIDAEFGIKINRSKNPIPSILSGYSGINHIRLFNIDRSKYYDYKSPETIASQKNMKYKLKQDYFFIENNYIYHTGASDSYRLKAVFESPEEVDAFNICEISECGCDVPVCNFQPILERNFPCGYLQARIEDATFQALVGSIKVPGEKENNSKDDIV